MSFICQIMAFCLWISLFWNFLLSFLCDWFLMPHLTFFLAFSRIDWKPTPEAWSGYPINIWVLLVAWNDFWWNWPCNYEWLWFWGLCLPKSSQRIPFMQTCHIWSKSRCWWLHKQLWCSSGYLLSIYSRARTKIEKDGILLLFPSILFVSQLSSSFKVIFE